MVKSQQSYVKEQKKFIKWSKDICLRFIIRYKKPIDATRADDSGSNKCLLESLQQSLSSHRWQVCRWSASLEKPCAPFSIVQKLFRFGGSHSTIWRQAGYQWCPLSGKRSPSGSGSGSGSLLPKQVQRTTQWWKEKVDGLEISDGPILSGWQSKLFETQTSMKVRWKILMR